MSLRIIYAVDDSVWIAAASRSSSLRQAVIAVDVCGYSAWMYQAKTHRPDLVASMNGVLGSDLPSTPVALCKTGCGRPMRSQKRVSSHGLCANCHQRQLRGKPVGVAGEKPVSKGKQCEVEACTREQYAKGLCNLDYQRQRSPGPRPEPLPDFTQPMCTFESCTRRVKARGMCKRHYEIWLSVASPELKVRRATYPSDDQLVAWCQVDYSLTKVARRVGVARETLRSYIEHRPELAERVESLKRLPPDVAAQRDRDAHRRWKERNPKSAKTVTLRPAPLLPEEARRRNTEARMRWKANNRERDRATNRRWATNRSREDVRRWNVYNAVRRANQRSQAAPASKAEILETIEYDAILRRDPCAYCGGPSGSLDHIQPINKAGSSVWENFTAACRRCNSSKGDKDLLRYLLWRLDDARQSPTPR